MISRTNSPTESDDVSEDFNISSSARDNGAENSNVGIYDVGNDKKIDFLSGMCRYTVSIYIFLVKVCVMKYIFCFNF